MQNLGVLTKKSVFNKMEGLGFDNSCSFKPTSGMDNDNKPISHVPSVKFKGSGKGTWKELLVLLGNSLDASLSSTSRVMARVTSIVSQGGVFYRHILFQKT